MSFVSTGPGEYAISISHGHTGSGSTPTFNFAAFEDYTVDMTYGLPRQVLRLKEYRVQMKTVNDALRARELKIKFPFVSYNHQLDNTPDEPRYPILLGGTALTIKESTRPLYMSEKAPSSYQITVYNADGEIETAINSISLIFETEYGSFK